MSDICVDTQRALLCVGDVVIQPTKRMWDILNVLRDSYPGYADYFTFSRALWSGYPASETTVRWYIAKLRKCLGKETIESRIGFGWRLTQEISERQKLK